MMMGHAIAVYYVRTGWVRRLAKLKPPQKFLFPVFGANPQNIIPVKIATYMVYIRIYQALIICSYFLAVKAAAALER